MRKFFTKLGVTSGQNCMGHWAGPGPAEEQPV